MNSLLSLLCSSYLRVRLRTDRGERFRVRRKACTATRALRIRYSLSTYDRAIRRTFACSIIEQASSKEKKKKKG